MGVLAVPPSVESRASSSLCHLVRSSAGTTCGEQDCHVQHWSDHLNSLLCAWSINNAGLFVGDAVAWSSHFSTSLGGVVGRATHFQACHSVLYYCTTNDRSRIEENSKGST